MIKKKGAIFDMDGTLLDSMWGWRQIDVDFLGRRGFEVPSDYGTNSVFTIEITGSS